MMQEYIRMKEQYPDCILFYRIGDFYEVFFDDALTTSRECELTLTGKQCGLPERAPMCGVPFHAVDIYISKMVEKGYRIAVCDQVEDPRFAKGLVKRAVTRIVTPGTKTSLETLDANRNNYIFCIFYDDNTSGIAVADVSTGDFYATQVNSLRGIVDEINKYSPAEIICNDAYLVSGADLDDLRGRLGIVVNALDSHYFGEHETTDILLRHFKVASLTALGIDSLKAGTVACGALMQYLYDTQLNNLDNITRIEAYLTGKYMLLDSATRRNLELTETMREKKVRGSLLWVLDKTKTAMGARLLHQFLEQPLIDRGEIEKRLDAVEALCKKTVDRDEIREYLQPVYDMERLLTKISYGSANPRDLLSFRESLKMLKPIRQVLSDFEDGDLAQIRDAISDFDDLVDTLQRALVDDPPLAMKEGGIIRDGYDEKVDQLRSAKTQGKQWLADLEEDARQKTGIGKLKVKYNSVFGYFFEVTNSFKDKVPADWTRKQTLVGSERYTTPRLKELEDTILNAQDRLNDLEYEKFSELRQMIADRIVDIQKSAKAVALLDVYCSLSVAAERNGYVRPKINEKGVIRIKNGRHPVVEQMMQGDFVSNDTILDNRKNCIAVITGPNMAGKSTYMRQVALISLMCQIGSFVPAQEADLCVVDRIFTRVGASDDLGSGQSTFMVEMNEVANILRNATPRSLIILDEIGRGTSTFDGLSIAWAVIEYISNRKFLGAKTLFATHYHELTELEGKIDNVNNYCVAVREKGDDIIFLRKIVKGGADRSYGIQVARLAGLPDIVVDRAKEIARQLSDNDITEKIQSIEVKGDAGGKTQKVPHYDEVDLGQMSLFDTVADNDVLQELENIDVTNMTPMDALNTLYRLQSELKNRWSAPGTGQKE
jgi:DNA mismatch repair protein MutS